MKTRKIKTVSLAESVAQRLLERIQQGEFGPGSRLPGERALQQQLGVGRLALREGLARLSALGVIRVEHGKGARVEDRINSQAVSTALAPLFPERDAKTMQDLVNARSLIEGELAARAAQRRTKGDVKRLESMLNDPGEALEDDHAYARLDYDFHREVARLADNEFLNVMHQALSDHIRSFLLFYAKAHADRKGAIERHRDIVKAIARGDASRARESMRSHITACKSSVEAYIAKKRKRQHEQPSQPGA